jgi:hypothetical protein
VEPFVQDHWKVSRRLTVNIGLRWSYMQPQYSALNNTSAFLPQFFDPTQAATINASTGAIVNPGNPYNGLVLGGSGFPKTATGRVTQANDPAVQRYSTICPKGPPAPIGTPGLRGLASLTI